MPRHHGSSAAVRSANVREMIRAGHKPSEAVAAAYKWQREDAAKKGKK